MRSQFAFDLLRLWNRKTLLAGEYRFDGRRRRSKSMRGLPEGMSSPGHSPFPRARTSLTSPRAPSRPGLQPAGSFSKPRSIRPGWWPTSTPAQKFGGLPVSRYVSICPQHNRRADRGRDGAPFRVVAGQLGLKENVHKVVTIASLVERETAVDEERPLIAGIFENRLGKKMPLMTDPAVIYGLCSTAAGAEQSTRAT